MEIFDFTHHAQGYKPEPRFLSSFDKAFELLETLMAELEREGYQLFDKPSKADAEESIRLTKRIRRMAVKSGKLDFFYSITKHNVE